MPDQQKIAAEVEQEMAVKFWQAHIEAANARALLRKAQEELAAKARDTADSDAAP